jgi:NAD(P)-dependent dehydrogenase (short-subunit alcohol dehydrogenase family)
MTGTEPRHFAVTPGLLANRVILVTGANGGFGRALCLAAARAGATVILAGRAAAKLDALYDEIEALGGPRPAIALLDLATAGAGEYDALAGRIGAEFGRLDGLVHGAALLGERTPRRSSSMTCRRGAACCT